MQLEQLLEITKGERKRMNGADGVWFAGPEETPENWLFIPLSDLGYKIIRVFSVNLLRHKRKIC